MDFLFRLRDGIGIEITLDGHGEPLQQLLL
jgi:hypothetical protein